MSVLVPSSGATVVLRRVVGVTPGAYFIILKSTIRERSRSQEGHTQNKEREVEQY